MPELPEVETTRRGILPYVEGEMVVKIIVRNASLRWPVPLSLHEMEGQRVESLMRRGKYLLFKTSKGTAILHLGMSGSLRIVDKDSGHQKHDHVDIVLKNNKALRLHDPRRFGALLWTQDDPFHHKLIRSLGPEPLSNAFNADYLYSQSRGRSVSIKQFIMNGQVVVGVGNIYACESLFKAGISPRRLAGKVSRKRYKTLVGMIKEVLALAIEQGGTTLRDFVQAEGKPGYFQQQLNVYGRAGEACLSCQSLVKQIKQGQRSTFYCGQCQR